jgi:hypothetical protein
MVWREVRRPKRVGHDEGEGAKLLVTHKLSKLSPNLVTGHSCSSIASLLAESFCHTINPIRSQPTELRDRAKGSSSYQSLVIP